MKSNLWYLYLLLCGDGSIYTGISPDPFKRLRAHQAGKGAKYTRGRGPIQLIFLVKAGNKSEALKRELQVKKLTHGGKLAMRNVKVLFIDDNDLLLKRL